MSNLPDFMPNSIIQLHNIGCPNEDIPGRLQRGYPVLFARSPEVFPDLAMVEAIVGTAEQQERIDQEQRERRAREQADAERYQRAHAKDLAKVEFRENRERERERKRQHQRAQSLRGSRLTKQQRRQRTIEIWEGRQDGMTLQQLGDKHALSKGRIQQIIAITERQLRWPKKHFHMRSRLARLPEVEDDIPRGVRTSWTPKQQWAEIERERD